MAGMKRNRLTRITALLLILLFCFTSIYSEDKTTNGKKLLVVGTAHLDTQWRWTIQSTINEFVPSTFRDNFKLMDIYPNYVFSYEGAFRYMLFKEYYPDEFQKLKKYVASGQWRVAGSWVDAVDVNIPSFESLVRHTLYGNGFFKQEFGKTSRDIFLPDCFGFGYALPSIAHHCGLKSFSTQKLTWGAAHGVPFDIGLWTGVDGSSIIAALNPGDYGTQIRGDLSRDTMWLRIIKHQEDTSGLSAAYMYFGTGDTGGSPDSLSVDWLVKSMKSDGPLTVKSSGSDDVVDVVSAADREKLPRYTGELLMTRHGVGCYSSQAAMKRWNRKNELLADATERASVVANVLSGQTYPREELRATWVRFLWHQFHDDVTGTSIPEAYEFSWNDEILCQNRFAGMFENAVEATTPQFETRGKGVPVILFNPLSIDRNDIVQASVRFPGKAPKAIKVVGPDGRETNAQIIVASTDSTTIAFKASVPSVGYAVYDVIPTEQPSKANLNLSITDRTLENERYKVTVNDEGNVTSVFDKLLQKELLSAPIQFQLLFDKPTRWPSWEIEYDHVMAQPRAILGGSAKIYVIENGPARIALAIERNSGKSFFRTVIRLAAGSDQVEFVNSIDWKEKETLLKVAFPLTSSNDSATYDLGLGAIKRGLNRKELYEVPGQQWADLSAPSKAYGVSILNDCKYGWDHPEAGVLRLTLIHTPGVYDSWSWVGDQKSMDLGHHEFSFSLYSHAGDVSGSTVTQAIRLNQPIRAFQTTAHAGTSGKSYSLLSIKQSSNPPGLLVNALKIAEESNEIIVRVREINGTAVQNAHLHFASPVISAREVTGSEDNIGTAQIENGDLVVNLTRYQPKAFAVTLKPNAKRVMASVNSQPITLTYDMDGISTDDNRTDGNLDGAGNTLSGDLLPDTSTISGIHFQFGPKTAGANNAVTCQGQEITLPTGDHNRLYLVLTAVGGPAHGTFTIDGQSHDVWVQDYTEPIAQWNNRLVAGRLVEEPEGISPAYINREPVAWYASHKHTVDGKNDAYRFTYLYLARFDITKNTKSITLPNNPHIKLFAATAATTSYDNIRDAQPLYDIREGTVAKITTDSSNFISHAIVRMSSPNPRAEIHYTLDGSDPDAASPIYTAPVTIDKTTEVKARAILAGSNDAFVTSITYHQLVPREAMKIGKVTPGLSFKYFEGEWAKLPNFDSVKAVKDSVMNDIIIPKYARPEDIGLTFDGYFSAPTDGMYEFIISSDDGSKVFVDDSLVIDNDGLHGTGEVSGQMALKAGYHKIYIPMFQSKGGIGLEAFIVGPGIPKEHLDGKRLFHITVKKK